MVDIILTGHLAQIIERQHNVNVDIQTRSYNRGSTADLYGWAAIPINWITEAAAIAGEY